jgi:hypothetical protein
LGWGGYLIDLAGQDLDPPVTTIAWRLAHIMVGCFVMRLDNEEFGGPQVYRGSYCTARATTPLPAPRRPQRRLPSWTPCT